MFLMLTDEDLEGRYMSLHDCPIARATKRKFPDYDVVVGGSPIDIGEQKCLPIKLPNREEQSVNEPDIAGMRNGTIFPCVEIVGLP